jgi:hypothetical protein
MKPISSHKVIINLQDDLKDFGSMDTMNLPIIVEYGAAPLHKISRHIEYGWDWECIFKEQSARIIQSETIEDSGGVLREGVLIKLDDRIFVKIFEFTINAYAPSRDQAFQVVKEFLEYAKTVEQSSGKYRILNKGFGDYGSTNVDLLDGQIPSENDLELLYGDGFIEWNQKFLEQIRSPKGLSIFEGNPGTGKTSYIRYLIKKLEETHRFYFVPPLITSAVCDPDFIDFWEKEKKYNKNLQFVCVFEDSEAVLMKREADNRQQVVSVLNMTDGLLADFLRLQVICTINCCRSEIDHALLRPGRLMSWRKFVRHQANHARRIAAKYGCQLSEQSDYSLAEIFNSDGIFEEENKRLGF